MRDERTAQLSLRALETFVAVVEAGSLSMGAKRLGTSASAVSIQLSNLERALNAKLIERSAQRFTVTDAGILFRERAIRILDEIDGARLDLVSSENSPHITLRIATVEDFDNHVLPHWLSALGETFANAKFIVRSGPSHENYSALSSRACDLIIASDTMEPADWIEEHPLLRDPYVLITASDLTEDPSLDALMQIPFIRYSREQHMGRQIEAQLRRVKTIPPFSHEFSSNQGLFAMVSATNGWAITTVSAVHGTFSHREAGHGTLGVYPLPVPAFSRRLSLYARRAALNRMPEQMAEKLRSTLNTIFFGSNSGIEYPVRPTIL